VDGGGCRPPPFSFTTSPADPRVAGVPKSLYLRVEFTLASADGVSSPVLRGYNVEWDGSGIN
jgi:hypothetical protein